MWEAIEKSISEVTGSRFTVDAARAVAGGSINEAMCLKGLGQKYFVKLNRPDRGAMFEAEAEGLQALDHSNTLRIPQVCALGADHKHSWLVLEYIELGSGGEQSQRLLGEKLARMHRCTAPAHGWHRDNTIGATQQVNTWNDDWLEFLRHERLGFQLSLAGNNGAPHTLIDAGQRLIEHLEVFFSDYRPPASLLHGDLWGGNWAADKTGEPVIFDPAVYYGDRESDLAMTELFGGFGTEFYAAYTATWCLDPGYTQRKYLYQLYHVLNHFNLFGGSYAQQSKQLVDRLLAALQ